MKPGIARLWIGMACVGTLVSLAVVTLWTGTAAHSLPTVEIAKVDEFLAFFGFFAVVAGLTLPFDLVGGLLIPLILEKRQIQLTQWTFTWCRSVATQLLFYSLSFFFYLQIGRDVGALWLLLIFGLLQVNLLAGQELIWRAMTSNRGGDVIRGATQFVQNQDERFAGGITGFPGCDSILIPEIWRTRLTAVNLMTLIERRQAAVRSGARLRGIVAAILWNFIIFTLALVTAGGSVGSVADLVNIYLWFLLFSFVGLLTLPALNRRSVFALDRHFAGESHAGALRQAISELDELTEQEPSRSVTAESVFQPIPCPERRVRELAREGSQLVPAWNVARTALFLSWAFGGPLARAVHCNVGRPELWAMMPAD